MRRPLTWSIFALLLATACSGSGAHDGGAAGTTGPGDVTPATSCGAGTRPIADGSACAPVGTRAAPDGFSARGDGWGFAAITASGACADGSRHALGQASCVPLDDCASPFPKGAKVVTGPDELDAALAAAKSGDTIALERGEYRAITLTKSVSLVGRCASGVVFRGTGERGIYAQRALTIALESLTVTGFQGGIVASYGPTVSLRNVRLQENVMGIVAGEAIVHMEGGLIEGGAPTGTAGYPTAANAGAKAEVTLTDVDVRSALLFAAGEGASLTARRSLVTRENTARASTALLQAWAGASLVVEDSRITTAAAVVLDTGRSLRTGDTQNAAPPHVRIAGTEIVQNDRVLDAGLMRARDGAHLELDNVTVEHRAAFATMVGDPESVLDAKNVVVRSPGESKEPRVAFYVGYSGLANVTDTAVIGAKGSAATVGHKGSRLTLSGALVTGTVSAAVATKSEASAGAMAIVVSDQASLSVADSAFVGNEQVGIAAGAQGRVEVSKSVFDDTTETATGEWGNPIIAAEGTQLWVRGSFFRKSADSALAFMKADGIVETSRFEDNAFDVAIEDTTYVEASAASDTIVAGAARFFQNRFQGGAPKKREGANVVTVPAF